MIIKKLDFPLGFSHIMGEQNPSLDSRRHIEKGVGMQKLLVLLAACFPLSLAAQTTQPPPGASAKIDYDTQVRPLLSQNCYSCHGLEVQQSGLRLDLRQNALRGGDYGPVINPGNSSESKLIKRLVNGDGGLQMPPTGALTDEEIAILRAWIDQGAEFRTEIAEEPAPKPVEARPPLHVVESLNSLSVDIARAIDHNASVELWDRYRRGERNVFTRRLYTIKGQQTFDEIRRKYQTDSEFRTAVDRYVADFEKLLEDVSASDRDSIMTQTYLTSDTGKVYTMLAHASGRIR